MTQYKIKTQPVFEKETKRLGKRYASLKADIASLIKDILDNPETGIDLGGGFRKIRMKITSKGKGKSGGARVITFTIVVSVDETEINLLYIYDKSERSSISKNELEEFLHLSGLK